MTCHLHIGDGVKTDKTLGELVGHVVTCLWHTDEPLILFVVKKDTRGNALVWEMDSNKLALWDIARTRVDLDHGPITLADAAPCRPEVTSAHDDDDQQPVPDIKVIDDPYFNYRYPSKNIFGGHHAH